MKKLKQKLVSWLLKGVHLDEIHIGERSVVISGTGANMDGQKVENVGAPDSDDDAPRRDTIDAKITTHKGDASAHHVKTTAGELNLADMAEKAHGSLTGVTSDQHHPQSHNAASHSDIASSGANIDDAVTKRHDRSHDHSLAADGTPIAVAGVPNLAASKITSGQFPLDRMPRAASGVLTAKGAGVNPAYEAVAVPTIVRKTADQTVNNSTVLVNDTHLVLPVLANEVWEFTLRLRIYSPSATPDVKYDFTIPVAGVLNIATQFSQTAYNVEVDGTVEAVAEGGLNSYVMLKYLYIGGVNPGDVQFRWAQNVATVEDTKILLGSFIIAHPII